MHRLAVLLPLRTNLACSPHKARTLWPGIVLRTFSDCIFFFFFFFDRIQLTFSSIHGKYMGYTRCKRIQAHSH
jgi:hypothetical protein